MPAAVGVGDVVECEKFPNAWYVLLLLIFARYFNAGRHLPATRALSARVLRHRRRSVSVLLPDDGCCARSTRTGTRHR